MNQPVIRPFVPADEQGVLDLILPIQQQEFGVAVTVEDQPDLRAIPSWYQTGRGGFLVAEHEGRIVGTIAMKDIGDLGSGTDRRGGGALRKMFVAADYRGRERGVAAALLRSLLDASRGKGIGTVYLGTTDRFLAAHRFYERSGFRPVAVEDLPERFPRMAVDTRFYVIDLG